jgi:hypothetical protein
MRICENGIYRDMTAEEVVEMEAARQTHERHYWTTTDYDSAVNAEIRKRYTVSQEFAILRQRDEKPDEYAAYYAYCEECKAFVKAQKAKYE